MNIALIYGGRSGEHEVSINSAKGVYPPLCNLGHTVYLIAITLEGRWFWQNRRDRKRQDPIHGKGTTMQTAGNTGNSRDLKLDDSNAATQQMPIERAIRTDSPLTIVPGEGIFCGKEKLPLDAAFAVTHGFGGEDGNLQGLCMLANLPLCGCSTLPSAIGMHKDIASRLFALEGIPTVPSQILHSHAVKWMEGEQGTPPCWFAMQNTTFAGTGAKGKRSDCTSSNTTIQPPDKPLQAQTGIERWAEACRILQKKLGPSLFIKPEDSGSSLGVTALRTPDGLSLRQAVLEARRHSGSVLVQTLVGPMDELECAVLETEKGNLIVAGPALVVDPGKQTNHFLSYAYKYTQVDSAYLQLPSLYPEEIEEQIRMYAKQAFRAIGAEGYARIDFFVSGESIYLNEINTSPGMTSKSHYPTLMGHAGYSMEEVLKMLIEGALRRKREETLRTYRPPEA